MLAETILGNGPRVVRQWTRRKPTISSGVPKTVDKGWLWDRRPTILAHGIRTAGARDALKGADKSSSDGYPALPMPGIEPALPFPGATGDDINRVYNILKGLPHGGQSGVRVHALTHAETLAGLARQFSDANEEEFATKAFEAKVPIDLIEPYGRARTVNQ